MSARTPQQAKDSNALAALLTAASTDGFIPLTERYRMADAILSSEWLAARDAEVQADERARIAADMACNDGCRPDPELLAETKRAAENPDRTEEVQRAFDIVRRSRKQQTAAMIRRLKNGEDR